MLHAIDPFVVSNFQPSFVPNELQHLELHYDDTTGVLWKYIAENSTAFFCHEQLDEIRAVQTKIDNGEDLELPNYRAADLRYVVCASKIPGVFSLGGDLQLFRDLIVKRDREGLRRYAMKATDATYHLANIKGKISTISLVQGTAMGGGFEAVLAGNVIVAERGVRMGFPEVLFGLFPGMGAYTLLRRRVTAIKAERIIMSAETYTAEALYDMDIVDILAEPGEGEQAVRDYVHAQRNRPGASAFRRTLNQLRSVESDELYAIADAWVDTAMELTPANIKRIERLVRSQHRAMSRKSSAVAMA